MQDSRSCCVVLIVVALGSLGRRVRPLKEEETERAEPVRGRFAMSDIVG